jgi:pantoate--beta-alanine ligase
VRVVETIAEFKAARQDVPRPLGFVPTMGYLHAGHISLVEQARADCATVAVSIFVNPTQFGPGEDFESYPRDTERDLSLCEAAGADLIFLPSAAEMYPAGAATWVDVESITSVLEGAVRPGHFRGVTTVVNKLFNIVAPDRAYFGQKDAQQLAVIRKMVTDLDMNLEVITGATVREPDGLAMSSRNVYLDPKARAQAVCLSEALFAARERYTTGERDAAVLRELMTGIIQRQPLARIDYVSLADNLTLEEIEVIAAPALASLAVRFGKTRLIDNVVLE